MRMSIKNGVSSECEVLCYMTFVGETTVAGCDLCSLLGNLGNGPRDYSFYWNCDHKEAIL